MLHDRQEGLLLYVLQVRTTHFRAHETRYIFVCTVTRLECRDTFTYVVTYSTACGASELLT